MGDNQMAQFQVNGYNEGISESLYLNLVDEQGVQPLYYNTPVVAPVVPSIPFIQLVPAQYNSYNTSFVYPDSNPVPVYDQYYDPSTFYPTQSYINPRKLRHLNQTSSYTLSSAKIIASKVLKAAVVTAALTIVLGNPLAVPAMVSLSVLATLIDAAITPVFVRLCKKKETSGVGLYKKFSFKERMVKMMTTLALTSLASGPLLHIHLQFSLARLIFGAAFRAYFSESSSWKPASVVFF